MSKAPGKKRIGQPPKGADALTEKVNTRIKKSDLKRGLQEAKSQGKSLAKLIRELFLDGLARLERKRGK